MAIYGEYNIEVCMLQITPKGHMKEVQTELKEHEAMMAFNALLDEQLNEMEIISTNDNYGLLEQFNATYMYITCNA